MLILGDGTVRTIPLNGDQWTVGRSSECSIVLRDPTVSRRHLMIERVDGQFHFRDLGGSNPVLLDGKATHHGILRVGQSLVIGLTRLVLEQRSAIPSVATEGLHTVVLSREIIDEEIPSIADQTPATTAARVLDRIEWTFADLGDLRDAAEPLLDLALNLASRRTGWLGRCNAQNTIELLAVLTPPGESAPTQMPESMLTEARRIARPHLVTTAETGGPKERLVVPLGKGGEGLLVLQSAQPGAPTGQELLRLASSLGRVIWHRLQETMERLRLRDEVRRLHFHGTAAHSALLMSTRLQDVRQLLRGFAGSSGPTWLSGEEGTEREDLARYLHAESPRRLRAFVPWNAAQGPSWRHERDLLGSGNDVGGLVARAIGGTLFIDHFDRLTMPAQKRLTTALRGISADGREPAVLIAGCLPGGESAIDQETAEWFSTQRIEVPPLRSDPRDVLALAELFLSEMGSCPNGAPRLLKERTKRLLTDYSWPGNVRELRLVLESAAAQAGDQPIAPRHLPPSIGTEPATPSAPAQVATLEEIERRYIVEVLQRLGGNRTRAAQLLGIANSTLYEKLKRYCIDD